MPDRVTEPARYRPALGAPTGVPATDGGTRHRPPSRRAARRGRPPPGGTAIGVPRNGDRIFPAMFEAVESATSTVDFLTFVYWQGSIGREMAELLAGRARDGVRVRVILDALGGVGVGRRPVGGA